MIAQAVRVVNMCPVVEAPVDLAAVPGAPAAPRISTDQGVGGSMQVTASPVPAV